MNGRKRRVLLFTWWLDIHWRNFYGSGLLEYLARDFDEIIVASPRPVPKDVVPPNVRLIQDRWLFSDPILDRLSSVIQLRGVLEISIKRAEISKFYRRDTPLKYWLACFAWPPVYSLYYLGVLLRVLIAWPKLRRMRPTVALTSSFVWGGYDSVVGMYLRLRRIPWHALVTSWDNPSCKGRFPLKPDRVIVWGDQNVEEAKRLLKISADRVVGLTPPHFVRILDIAAEPATRGKHIALIGVGKVNYLHETEFVHKLVQLLQKDGTLKKIPLIIRPHPNDSGAWTQQFTGMENVIIDPATEKHASTWTVYSTDRDALDSYYRLLRDAVVVITHYSTALVEAGLMRVPCIVPRIPFPEDLRFFTRHDWLPHSFEMRKSPGLLSVSSVDELRAALRKTVQQGLPQSAIDTHFKACEVVAKFPSKTLFADYARILSEPGP